ncbi:MAG: hypothetical protein JSS02_00020, partial [Planctomycetes bacterium]|nr:hypothetical protein [Planctomycetota bacterium]
PDSADTTGLMQLLIKSVLNKAQGKNELSDDQSEELMKHSLVIGRGFQFLLGLPESADAHYAGKGVKRDDKNRPILWYKPAGAMGYRVIFADLSAKDADAAPVVEGARRVTKAGPAGKPAGQ